MTEIKGRTAHVGSPEWSDYPEDVRRTLAWRRLHQLVDHSALKGNAAPGDPSKKLLFMVKYPERVKEGR